MDVYCSRTWIFVSWKCFDFVFRPYFNNHSGENLRVDVGAFPSCREERNMKLKHPYKFEAFSFCLTPMVATVGVLIWRTCLSDSRESLIRKDGHNTVSSICEENVSSTNQENSNEACGNLGGKG